MLKRLLVWLARKSEVHPWLDGSINDESIPLAEAFGIEVKDDNVTPMDFVVHALESVLSIKQDDAVRLMLQVHTRGSVTVGRVSHPVAQRFVEQLTQLAGNHGYPLVCRVVPAMALDAKQLPSSDWND
jgi:ATP-dependent Clp protease adaptor protein ClpS